LKGERVFGHPKKSLKGLPKWKRNPNWENKYKWGRAKILKRKGLGNY